MIPENVIRKSLASRGVEFFYHSRVLNRLVPTVKSCVEHELKGFASVLDLGCGSNSLISDLGGDYYRVGVEGNSDAVALATKSKTHDYIFHADLREADFPEMSFDVVVLLEVIEHMPHEDGRKLIEKAQKWARKKVIISTPNGFWPQGALDGNVLQIHVCGWTIEELEALGMRVSGLAGLRALRRENEGIPKEGVSPLAATLKWKPWQITLAMAAITQIYTYYRPKYAFELFAVWERKE